MRRIYAVGAEFRPLARATGLAEFGGLLTEIARQDPTTHVCCLLPKYGGMNMDAGERPANLEFRSVGPELPCVQVSPDGRIKQPLPEDDHVWEQFANGVLSDLESEKQEFGLLALDWPAGRLVAKLKQERFRYAKVTFTTDLVPEAGTHAYDLWSEGVAAADTIHLPTPYWREYLRSKPYAQPLFENETNIQCLRYGFDASSYHARRNALGYPAKYLERRQSEQKLIVQNHFGLNPDRDAMVVIAVNRWSKDDQKNNKLILRYAKELLQPRARKIQLIIGNTSQQFKDAKLKEEFQEIRESSRCLGIGGMRWADLLAGVDLQLMPSRYEPCGLNHCQGMAMGVVPVCSRTGCMGDPAGPMADGHNSFLFDWDDAACAASSHAFFKTLERAVDCYFSRRPEWNEIVQRAMEAAEQYEWSAVASEYKQMICGKFAGS